MPRIVHFEIHASNPQRAIAFYQTVFGWKFQKWDGPMPYWLISTGEGKGIDGGLVARRGPEPVEGQAVNAFPCTVDCENVDAVLASVQKANGTVAVPKMPIPGVGWLAYFKDTEGNIFGAMQSDPTAK